MPASELLTVVTATVNKHHVAGITAIAIGAILVIIGGLRVATRASRAIGVPIFGLVIALLGVLTYIRAI
ncbi:MAG TPA: hypothetical protein VKR27_02845 [Acidimicrobiales bacterium]|jgi:hypothetical protein|nr:hypothetical protein [Acidimicrobiales bacterium]